ncbi:hypothetical protein [Jiangella gansuensis]|nr:hypothetical protein [Jiangella gansuensis]
MSVTVGDRPALVPLRRWLISPGTQYKIIGTLLAVLAGSFSALLLIHS